MIEKNTGFHSTVGKLQRALILLRAQPFEQDTAEGRANERHRRVLLMTMAAAVAKVISVAVALISLPLAYRYLGVERYELWVTLSTSIAMLSFADLGIGSGLLNLISTAHGKGDKVAAASAVASAFFMLVAVGMVLTLFFISIFPFIPWAYLFKVTSPLALSELDHSLKIIFACFVLNLILSTVTRIQMGFQEGFINSMWQIAGSLLSLIGLFVVLFYKAGLPFLVTAFAGAPILATLLNLLMLFGRNRPWLLPRWRNVSSGTVVWLCRMGLYFFILQLTYSLAFLSDNFIAKHFLPVGAVTDYSAVARLFGLAPMVMEMALSPLWPAYAEAASREDNAWIRKTLKRTFAVSVVFAGTIALVLGIVGSAIIHVWMGPEVSPSSFLLLGWAIWSVLSVAGTAVAMFLNGSGAIRFQATCAIVMSLIGLVLKIIFASRFGLSGIIWATIIAYVLFIAVPMIFYVPRLLKGDGTVRL